MAITTTSVLGDTIPTIIAKARFTEQFKPVIGKLAWRVNKPEHTGTTYNVPYFGTMTANALSEGVDMASPESMVDTNVQITPAEVGVQAILSWKLMRDDQEDVKSACGRIMGEAIVAKEEYDLGVQLDDATTSLGTTATTLTLGVIAAAWANLAGNAISAGGPAPEPYAVVHHPFVLLDIIDVLTPTLATTVATYQGVTGTSGLVDQALMGGQGAMGRLFGMNVYSSGNLTRGRNTTATTDVKGGVFATGEGGGLLYVVSKEWQVYPEDDASLRATELNAVVEYGCGEYLAGWIVELYNDATTPA